MTRLAAGAALCIASIALSGCGVIGGDDGYFRDRSDDYQLANSLPPLRVPEGVTTKQQEELYEIPRLGNSELERGKFEVPRPQALSVNVGLDRVKIQKLGSRRWVLVSQPPAEVWPQLHYFLRTAGLQLERSDASMGIMETAWLSFRDTPEIRDKYQLRIESGVQPDTTEIHVRHISAPADAPVQQPVEWPALSQNQEREGWMIDEMSNALAAETSGAAASLMAQDIGRSDSKVKLIEPAGRDPYLSLELVMGRAWATVAHALNAGAYRLHLEDVEQRVFYVTYDEDREVTQEEKGWFSRWGSDDSDELAEKAATFSMEEVFANVDAAADPVLFGGISGIGIGSPREIPGYLIVLREVDGIIQVHIRTTRGQPLSRLKASELLLAIRQNLI